MSFRRDWGPCLARDTVTASSVVQRVAVDRRKNADAIGSGWSGPFERRLDGGTT